MVLVPTLRFAVASHLRIRRHDAPFCLRLTVPSFTRISLA
jgi:hypothetical protein